MEKNLRVKKKSRKILCLKEKKFVKMRGNSYTHDGWSEILCFILFVCAIRRIFESLSAFLSFFLATMGDGGGNQC